MKTTYDWLRDYVDLDVSPQEVAERLTMLGLEVESLEQVSPQFKDVVAARIVSVRPLEGSDHLVVAEVDAGPAGKFTTVSGAPNVLEGSVGVFALPGAALPGGVSVEERRFGNVVSRGMLCSEAELGLTSRADQLWLLEDVEPGTDVAKLVGEDWVYEISVTPNRPDCLGTVGIARELAAYYGLQLRVPEPHVPEEPDTKVTDHVAVEVLDSENCPRYTARYLWDLEVRPSPFWMARRLELAGMRAINNIVDVTNYVMLELGQPLHAFDYDLLDGGKIVVRKAAAGEEFVTLDGKQHRLDNDMLMICDAAQPVAIAGVMGGENSEVRPETRRVLLESAYFRPESIRRTRRRLGISTESSYRFERGVDPNGVVRASDRAAELMAATAGAKVASGVLDVYPRPQEPWEVRLRPNRVVQVLGADIPVSRVTAILEGLDLKVQASADDHLSVQVPTFRPDLTREIDLIEEIARHYGYDSIEPDLRAEIDQTLAGRGRDHWLNKARDLLTAMGFYEAVNLSFLSRSEASSFTTEPERLVRVINPLGEDLAWLRPSLLPGLLTSAVRNINRRTESVMLFEHGKVFSRGQDASYREHTALAAVASGAFALRHWRASPRLVDFYDLKGAVEVLVRRLTGQTPRFEAVELPWFSTGFSVQVEERTVGVVGELSDSVLKKFDSEQSVFAFELSWDDLRQFCREERLYAPVPRFPAVVQDLALLADENVPAGAIEAVIRKHGGPHLKAVELFDLYRGKQIPAGKKSLAYTLRFQADDRTLTEDEVRAQIDEILEALKSELGVVLRPR